MHIIQTQGFAFDMVITPSLTVQTSGSNVAIEFIVIYSSCYTMLVEVMKLPQLASYNCIYIELLYSFMVVTSSLK